VATIPNIKHILKSAVYAAKDVAEEYRDEIKLFFRGKKHDVHSVS